MKKVLINFITLLSLLYGIHSNAQSLLPYNSISEAEDQLISYIKATSEFPSKMFADLLVKDTRCFYYDFVKLIDACSYVECSRSRPLDIVSSDDGKVKLYSWDFNGGTMTNYSYAVTFMSSKGLVTYANPWDYSEYKDLTEEQRKSADLSIIADGAEEIRSHKLINGKTVYIVQSFLTGSRKMNSKYIDAYSIEGDRISPYPLFCTNKEYKSSLVVHFDPIYDDIYDYDILYDKTKILVPETREIDNPLGFGIHTDRMLLYEFDGYHYNYQYPVCNMHLHSSVANYLYNVFILNHGRWNIRVDKMPDGNYRYAAWKDTPTCEIPSLVLKSGYLITQIPNPNEPNTRIDKYLFYNGEYSYEIMMELDTVRVGRKVVIVKRNGKVILTCNSF